MHLRSLRLRGFKSFADATELHFEPGVAVVVGPNGSGKSNVAEALAWAMAGQPPSELRLGGAVDVLFGGSDRRPPSGLCEVELVLDNEDGAFGDGRPEISIMRRLRRDGESTYLLNRAAVRRLDVQEALADAGLGRDLHAVISQGRVEEILLSRPAHRRDLMEEAAGLGKYKRRRHRAEGKLGRVEADLARARDLEGELAGRLRPLALQASAAERADELGHRIAAARLVLVGSEIAGARRRRAALASQSAEVEDARRELDAALAAVAARRAATEAELAGLAGEQERASERFWAVGRAVDRLEARHEALAERLGQLAEEERRAVARAGRLRGEEAAARTGAARADEELAACVARLATLEGDDDEHALATLGAEAAASLDTVLAARRALAELEGRQARAAGDAVEAARRVEAVAARAAAVAGEAEAAAVERREADARLLSAEHGRHEADTRAARADRVRQAASAAAERSRAAEREAAGARADLAERARAAHARHEASTAAVERGDGLSPALRGLAREGVTLALDALVVAADAERAVAAALEWRAAEAVADDADAAVELLGNDDLAGAALLCLDRLPARATPAVGSPLAARVAVRDGASPQLVASLFAGVHLVASSAELTRARRGLTVTADGLGFDADRGVAFRAGGGQAAALGHRRERDEAGAARVLAEEALRRGDDVLEAARAALATAAEEERRARAAAAEAARLIETAGRTHAEAQRQAEAAARRVETGLERLTGARDEEERLRLRVAESSAEAEALAAERAGVAARVDALVAGHAALEERRAEVAERAARLRVERAGAAERIGRVRADRDRHVHAAELAGRRADRAARRASGLGALAERLPGALETIAAAATRGGLLRRPDGERLADLDRRGAELAGALLRLASEAAALDGQARATAAQATTLEVEAAQVEERLGEAVRRRRELVHGSGQTPVDRVDPLPPDELAAQAATVERLERRLAGLGAVNPLAAQEYEEARARAADVAEQIADLEGALRELRRLIRALSAEIRDRFDATFGLVQASFAEVVETLFPGGRGRLRLVAPAAGGQDGSDGDPGAADAPQERGEPGVELEIQPAGKQIRSLAVLSGGEKALGAIAFLFALMLARPCPFYVLDEVEAALDDANIERFLTLVGRFRDRAQFIVITHQQRTMGAADTLYGVTMAGDGVSKVLSRRLPREAEERRALLEPA